MNEAPCKPGQAAEEAASAYLLSKGWRFVAANYRTSRGEIDVIAFDGECLVFVEVKSGRNRLLGAPALRVGAVKQKRLILTARQYIADNESNAAEYRFDVLSLIPNGKDEWQIEHIRDAFRPDAEDI